MIAYQIQEIGIDNAIPEKECLTICEKGVCCKRRYVFETTSLHNTFIWQNYMTIIKGKERYTEVIQE